MSRFALVRSGAVTSALWLLHATLFCCDLLKQWSLSHGPWTEVEFAITDLGREIPFDFYWLSSFAVLLPAALAHLLLLNLYPKKPNLYYIRVSAFMAGASKIFGMYTNVARIATGDDVSDSQLAIGISVSLFYGLTYAIYPTDDYLINALMGNRQWFDELELRATRHLSFNSVESVNEEKASRRNSMGATIEDMFACEAESPIATINVPDLVTVKGRYRLFKKVRRRVEKTHRRAFRDMVISLKSAHDLSHSRDVDIDIEAKTCRQRLYVFWLSVKFHIDKSYSGIVAPVIDDAGGGEWFVDIMSKVFGWDSPWYQVTGAIIMGVVGLAANIEKEYVGKTNDWFALIVNHVSQFCTYGLSIADLYFGVMVLAKWQSFETLEIPDWLVFVGFAFAFWATGEAIVANRTLIKKINRAYQRKTLGMIADEGGQKEQKHAPSAKVVPLFGIDAVSA